MLHLIAGDGAAEGYGFGIQGGRGLVNRLIAIQACARGGLVSGIVGVNLGWRVTPGGLRPARFPPKWVGNRRPFYYSQ
jgi:hypothetical protein